MKTLGLAKAATLHSPHARVAPAAPGLATATATSAGHAANESQIDALAEAPTSLPPVQRLDSTARFLQRPSMRALKALMWGLCRTNASLASLLAIRILSTPPRFKAQASEAALLAAAERHTVVVGVNRLMMYRWGDGPAVLLVHAWGGRSAQWAALVQPLVAAGLSVYALDGPAHGASEGQRTDMVEFAAALSTVGQYIEARHGRLHALIGHSFGAAMIQLAARLHGLKARKVVMISSFTDSFWFTELFAHHFNVSQPVLQRARELFLQRYGYITDWERLSVQSALRMNDVPTLLVHDTQDQEVPHHHAQTLAAAAPHAKLFSTTGLGHRRILRDAAVTRAVTHFASAAD